MTIETLEKMVKEGKLKVHHTALARGYVKVNETIINSYSGKFGNGFAALNHHEFSTRYHYVTYYVEG